MIVTVLRIEKYPIEMAMDGPDADRLDTKDFYEGDLSLYREFAHPNGKFREI